MQEGATHGGNSVNARRPRVRFGPFELDLRARELRKEGRRIRLQEQPFQILRMLLESPGEVVTREDIRKGLWPEGRVVEFDHSINAAVKRLRDALRDSAEKPRYIETLARRGYRFIGEFDTGDPSTPVEPVVVMPGLQQEPVRRHRRKDVQPSDRPPTPRHSVLLRVAGIALLTIAGTAFWLLSRTSSERYSLAPVPLTSYPGQEVEPSFSPDGKQVAFSWNGTNQDNFDIYVKQIGKDYPVRLTTDSRRDFSPAWSPDGQTIAFGRILSANRSAIYLIPVHGGPERKLVESVTPAAFRPGPFVAWSPDGKWIAYSDVDQADTQLAPTGSRPVSLFLISPETRENRVLTSTPENSVGDSGPAFAPDGHALAFIRTQTLAISKLYWLPLARNLIPSGEPRPVTSGSSWTSHPSWSPDGKEIIFAAGPWSRLQLWRVAEMGIPGPQRLALSDGHANEPTVSRRGQLAYSERSTDVNIWRTALSPLGGAVGASRRFAASTLSDSSPSFSPDGKRVVFASDRGGTREIWICDADGSNTMQLTSMRAPISGSPDWSPDSSYIVFDSNLDGQFDLFIISASGGAVRRLTNTSADGSHGRWSPDGRWIYFMSSRSGQRQVWKIPSNGGEAVQVTRNGGVVPYPSADGEFLYYSERAGQRESNGLGGLRRLRLTDGRDERILPSVTYMNVALARDGIYFIPRAVPGEYHSVYFFGFKTKQVTPIIRLTGAVSEGLTLSPDGRSLLFTQIDSSISDLMLIEDYRQSAEAR
ncbi:MAG TPA: winged helix-turn-helix domain-containing protein [Bryobacteraceae bacterium]